MTITLDTSGAVMTLRTRSGVDLHFVIDVQDASGVPIDLVGHTVIAHAYLSAKLPTARGQRRVRASPSQRG